jgi:hypothetical protein
VVLFDAFERSDNSWARHGEDSFTFLNRAAGPVWENVRRELEQWFQSFPSPDSVDLRERFRNRRPDQHWGAWWELYLFRVFSSLGFDIDVHPELPDSPARPDFRLGGESPTYIEATTVFSGIVEEGRHGAREGWILDALNEGKSDSFFVWVHMEAVGQARPRASEIVRPVEQWLDALDPDPVMAARDAGHPLPSQVFTFRDWRIRLEAVPKKPEARGNPAHRLIGIGPASVGFVNDRSMVGRALDRKYKRHAKVNAPLLLAVLGMSPVLDDEDVCQALFGTEAVEVDTGRLMRRPDGFWRGPKGPTGTGASAVLLGSGIQPWTAVRRLPRLWVNPWPRHPLEINVPFGQAVVENERVAFVAETASAHEILGLSADWPGDLDNPF